MALNQSVFIYRKSSIYEHGAYATLLTNSDKIDNSGYDDIQYVGIVHLQDFIQNITQPPNWIIKRIRLNYESQKK
ncbi:MAG: hypothetical protein E6R13_09200 [Spirochaetes bacterium]|nr:MAG: hypothetical protein E6R13_09200 [Spirochaetota bacterium]